MRLTLRRAAAEIDGTATEVALASDGDGGSASTTVRLGPLELVLAADVGPDGAADRILMWSVRNASATDVRVRSVALVFEVEERDGALRMFRHGYQSWSPCGVATFGVDEDPSRQAHFEFLQGVHAADQRDARPGELRSEWVTVLADDGGGAGPRLAGFEAGTDHDGTFRLRPAAADGAELWAEAFLGDARLPADATRVLHPLVLAGGDIRSADALLAAWADRAGAVAGARTSAPYQLGWCSWYHYFHDVTEEHIRANLAIAAAQGWPFDVFQLDDGFQSAIGDWLTTNDAFPSGLAAVADAITAAGFRAGLWIAPFLVAPDSVVATEHPDWLIGRRPSDDDPGAAPEPLVCWWNPPWGGGRDGFMYGLDTSNPAVLDHLRAVAAALVAMGFTYLKLDFTFSPSLDGVYHDDTRTPAERVRAGYAAVRDGAGDDAFILGCGVPLAPVVGLVDGNRIGQDVAPLWALDPSAEIIRGYLAVQPATLHAFGNTLARAFMHRRLWLNDPDCLMLRASDTELSPVAAHTWARAVGLSGGMALVSDDLALLDNDARALLDEAVRLGRAADAEAEAGRTPVVPDLLERSVPTTIRAAGHELTADPTDGSSTFT